MINFFITLIKTTVLLSYILYIFMFITYTNQLLVFYTDYIIQKRNLIIYPFIKNLDNWKNKKSNIYTIKDKKNIDINSISTKNNTIYLINPKYKETKNDINYINSVNYYPLHIINCKHFYFRSVCLQIR